MVYLSCALWSGGTGVITTGPAAFICPAQTAAGHGGFSGCRLDIHLVKPFNFLHGTKVGGHPSRDRRLAIDPAAGGVLIEPGLAAKVGLFPAQRRKGLHELVGGHLTGLSFSLVCLLCSLAQFP